MLRKTNTVDFIPFPFLDFIWLKKIMNVWIKCKEKSNGLWVVGRDPLGFEPPFHRDLLRPSGNTDIYIATHNSSKIAVIKQQ